MLTSLPDRRFADAIEVATDAGIRLSELIVDAGVLYGWPWWNCVLTRSTRVDRGLPGAVVAGSDAMWRVVGRLPVGEPVEWLIPVTRQTRTSGGVELAAGQAGAGRVLSVVEVVGTSRATVRVRESDAASSDGDELRSVVTDWAIVGGLGAARTMTLPEMVEAVASGWLLGGDLRCGTIVTALTGRHPDAGETVWAAAAAAAVVQFVASHGLTVSEVMVDDLEWLLERCRADLGDVAAVLAMVLDLSAQTTAVMRRMWLRPAWSGGMLDWATPSPLGVPAPRVGDHDQMVSGDR